MNTEPFRAVRPASAPPPAPPTGALRRPRPQGAEGPAAAPDDDPSLLTVVAVACTALKVTSWWACIPPAVMLGLYLLLLREAALADAEHARLRAAETARAEAARERAPEADWASDEQPSAQIIDISARVSDQLYDQYADATVRAVGD